MEQINSIFLRVLAGALRGEKAEIAERLTPEQWQEILRRAQIHKVLPLVLDAVHGCPGIDCLDEAELGKYRRQARYQVMIQTLRTGEFLELNRALDAAGIRPLVVKGLVCRQLYPQADLRPSGDEDLLVRQEDFAACCRILEELGLKRITEAQDAYEVSFRKAESPLHIELHRQLFAPDSQAYGDLNRFFEDVFHGAAELEAEGERVMTLAPTDHLFYLICHAFKHFIHSGFGIRQVCDIVLFARRYDSEICWERVKENCEAIRADRFAAAIFRIGEKYLDVEAPAAFRTPDVEESPLLTDLLEGGLYGDASLSRKHSSNITLETVAAGKRGKRPRGAMAAAVFPSGEKLAGRYPYLKKYPWLLPAAWGQRLWQYARETRKNGDSSAAEALKIGQERVELLRRYGIIR